MDCATLHPTARPLQFRGDFCWLQDDIAQFVLYFLFNMVILVIGCFYGYFTISRLIALRKTTLSVGHSVKFGASPRAAIALAAASRARALLHGRRNASFEDVQALASAVLCHRMILDFAIRAAGKTTADLVKAILEEVPEQDLATPAVLAEK